MTQFPKKDYPVRWIAVSQIVVLWPEAQRAKHDRNVERIMKDFDPDAFGVATVSAANAEGMHHAIDGQTRIEAVRRLWGEKEMVPCTVLDVTDPKEAARIFLMMNGGREKPGPVEMFKVALTAGHADQVAVAKIAKDHGYRIGFGGDDGILSAVSVCLKIYRQHGPEVLAETLDIITKIWGRSRDAVVSPVIGGLADVLAKYNGTLDRGRLVKLVSKKYPPARFIGAARQAKEFQGGTVTAAVSSVLVNVYNSGIAAEKRLPEK